LGPHAATRILSTEARRTALAFAEAIVPGSARIRAADEATLDKVAEVFGTISPHVVKGLAFAQQALDALAVARTGRRFRALDRDAQDRMLEVWEGAPVTRELLNAVAFAYKFIHFDDPPVMSGVSDARALEVVREAERPRWLSQVHTAEALPAGEDLACEVVVVGTGAGGGIVGRELAERGFAVVFVEEGDLYRRGDYDGGFVRAQTTFYRNVVAFGNSPMPTFMGRMVGGSTALNGGTCLYPPDAVFEEWCELVGTRELSREALRPWFERVELRLDVGPPDRRHVGKIADVFDRGCKKLGWSCGPIRRNTVGCEGAGFCHFGCASGAKRSTDVSCIPPALERGGVLVTGMRADKVLTRGGRAVGIEGVAASGKRVRVNADAVVFAGGAVPTPAFLLRNGIGKASGMVGRNLTLHPSGGVAATFDERIDPERSIPQAYLCDEFLDEGILILGAQPDMNIAPLMFPTTGRRLMQALDELPYVAGFGVLAKDTHRRGRVWTDAKGYPVVTYNLAPADVARLHRGMVLTAEMCLAAGARSVFPSLVGVKRICSEADLDAFKAAKLSPGQFALTSYHPLGTCRMGTDPARSVVSPDHEAHDLPGFYVVDGSTVPGPTGVNPQLTIMAMATRAAHAIGDRLEARRA